MYNAEASFGKVAMGPLSFDDYDYEDCFNSFNDNDEEFVQSDDNNTSWYRTLEPTTFVQVSAGGSHCAGLTKNGTLYTWGLASSGETGHHHTPIEVAIPRKVFRWRRICIESQKLRVVLITL